MDVISLTTDHKPLAAIMEPKKGILSLASTHLQRWEICCQLKYPLQVHHKPWQYWWSVKVNTLNTSYTAQEQVLPVTFGNVLKATRWATMPGKVYHYVQEWWPNNGTITPIPLIMQLCSTPSSFIRLEFSPYQSSRNEGNCMKLIFGGLASNKIISILSS